VVVNGIIETKAVPGVVEYAQVAYLFILISRFAETADHYFQLGDDEPLAIESVPVKLK
jgi:hypothetical protein